MVDLNDLLMSLKAGQLEPLILTDDELEYLIDLVEDEIELMKDIVA